MSSGADEFGEQPAIATATAVRKEWQGICHMMADVQTQPEIVFLIVGWPAWIHTRPRVEGLKDHKDWKNQQGLEKIIRLSCSGYRSIFRPDIF